MLYTTLCRTLRMRSGLILLTLVALFGALISAPAPGAEAVTPPDPLPAQSNTNGTFRSARVAGAHAVFLAGNVLDNRFDLFSVPLTGGFATRLTAGIPPGTVNEYQVTPAGRVVFVSRRDGDSRLYLYSVPAAGGTPLLLGPTYPPRKPGQFQGSQLIFGLAGERVVFGVDSRITNGFELFSVPAAGGQTVRLSPELPADTTHAYPAPFWATTFAIDDGARTHVAFNIRQGPVGQGSGLYAVPADGSAQPRRIGQGVGSAAAIKLDLTPDGAHVIYKTDSELRTARFDGGGEALVASGSSFNFAITANSARVVYTGNEGQGMAIKSVLAGGGTSVTVATDIFYIGSQTLALSPDSTTVFYNDAAQTALLAAPVAGGDKQTVYDAPIYPRDIHFTADNVYAVFIAGGGLYRYPIGGGTATLIASPTIGEGGSFWIEGITAGGLVVYHVRPDPQASMRLYSVPVAGDPSMPLTESFGPGEELIAVQDLSIDGKLLFITGDRLQPLPWRWNNLYVVPADGSAPALHLSPLPTVHLPAIQR